jgi:hypothetical protein
MILFLEGRGGGEPQAAGRHLPAKLRQGWRPTGRWWLVECYNPRHGCRVIAAGGPVSFQAGAKPTGRVVECGGAGSQDGPIIGTPGVGLEPCQEGTPGGSRSEV